MLGQRSEEDVAEPVKPSAPSRKRKQTAATGAVLNGTLPAALGDTGVRILADLGVAGGAIHDGAPATGVAVAGEGLTGAAISPTPLVSYSS